MTRAFLILASAVSFSFGSAPAEDLKKAATKKAIKTAAMATPVGPAILAIDTAKKAKAIKDMAGHDGPAYWLEFAAFPDPERAKQFSKTLKRSRVKTRVVQTDGLHAVISDDIYPNSQEAIGAAREAIAASQFVPRVLTTAP